MRTYRLCFALVTFLILESCSSDFKVFKLESGTERLEVRKGFFHGIHYISINRKAEKRLESRIVYDCACDGWQMELKKYDHNNATWFAVTDTSNTVMFFEQELPNDILIHPILFQPLTDQEKKILINGIEASGLRCCTFEKDISRVIGFVKRIPLEHSK